MALYTVSGTLPVTPVFDFSKSLEFMSNFAPMYDEQEVTETELTKAMMINGRCIAFRVQDAGSVEQPMVSCTLFSEEPLDEISRRKVIERIAFFLSLQDDLRPFYAIAEQDEDFAPVIQRWYGLRHVKFLTLCEIACWSVLVQHRAMPLARTMKAAAALRSIKGIGPWSAAFILLRGLGRMERLLSDMQPFQDALKKLYRSGITMQQLEQRYGLWFGYWGFYLRTAA